MCQDVAMNTNTPKIIYLKEYAPYPFEVEALDLNFDIHDGYTLVTARSYWNAKDGGDLTVVLNGEALELLSLTVDGQAFEGYVRDEFTLSFKAPSETFTLDIVTKISPETNTRLEGLYMSGGNYCTQCEAEGFRRITFWPDRPDVLSVYTVRVETAQSFPVLLSNGNKIDAGSLDNGRHFTAWHDPFPKPCYLFALVAGDLAEVADTYTTASGRTVDLRIYVRPGDESQCGHAMDSLKRSMRWDEEAYGLEYDLDLFNIVAVSDFNMGAMENKSLNIFNTALVLAAPETATDQDYDRVESVIAHEYFHNWSGNRVTCRDWFQLSLKEGLTVFRDQEFSADMHSRAVQRIDDVTHLRRMQFSEDAGPLAHPVRPESYIEINNFYTMTIYEKGAEVIRMMRTLMGAEKYRKGTDLYFKRHDGQAVTCEDFVRCMEGASGLDFSQFRLWYTQAGTPEVGFQGLYDAQDKTYRVQLTQNTPPTPGQDVKKPMHIPVAIGLLDEAGQEIDLGGQTTRILELKQDVQSFVFDNIPCPPAPSVLRDFSAPVKLKMEMDARDLAFLMVHDSDGFNRWEAGQSLYARVIQELCDARARGENPPVCPHFLETIGDLIEKAQGPDQDKALMARALSLPAVGTLEQARTKADPVVLHAARQSVLQAIKAAHRAALEALYAQNAPEEALGFSLSAHSVGRRSLQNAALIILTSSYGENCAVRAKAHYEGATTMTDRVAALGVLTHMNSDVRAEAFEHFYNKFKDFPLVLDKWFSLQALSSQPGTIHDLKKLSQHHDFNIRNPNRTRALYASFAMNNPVIFHAADGSGYNFLTDAVLELNALNPQIAARLLTPMRGWRGYSEDRQALMKTCLQRILDQPELAPDVYEIASKSLAA